MGINKHSLYDKHTYSLGLFDVADDRIEEGLFCKLDSFGRLQLAGVGELGFLVHYPENAEFKPSLNGLAISKAGLFYGTYSVTLDENSFDSSYLYNEGDELVIDSGGVLTNDLSIANSPYCVAVCTKAYEQNDKYYITIVSCTPRKVSGGGSVAPPPPAPPPPEDEIDERIEALVCNVVRFDSMEDDFSHNGYDCGIEFNEYLADMDTCAIILTGGGKKMKDNTRFEDDYPIGTNVPSWIFNYTDNEKYFVSDICEGDASNFYLDRNPTGNDPYKCFIVIARMYDYEPLPEESYEDHFIRRTKIKRVITIPIDDSSVGTVKDNALNSIEYLVEWCTKNNDGSIFEDEDTIVNDIDYDGSWDFGSDLIDANDKSMSYYDGFGFVFVSNQPSMDSYIKLGDEFTEEKYIELEDNGGYTPDGLHQVIYTTGHDRYIDLTIPPNPNPGTQYYLHIVIMRAHDMYDFDNNDDHEYIVKRFITVPIQTVLQTRTRRA